MTKLNAIQQQVIPRLKQVGYVHRKTPTVCFWGGKPNIRGNEGTWFLSNHGPMVFDYLGHVFQNGEQAMMWAKANHFGDKYNAEKILNTPNPNEAKAYGRMVRPFRVDEWSKVCEGYVKDICRERITQNSNILEKFLAFPKGTLFIEGSPYDRIWGVGINKNEASCSDPEQWQGLNRLGFILTELHQELLQGV